MTRTEFLENVTTWGDLIDFCYREDCNLCDNVYYEESRDDYINERLMDWARDDSWEELLRKLQAIPTGYEYYELDDYYDEWYALDDNELEDRISQVLEWMDEGGYWDEEVEDAEEEECAGEAPYDPEDEVPVEEEDCSLGDLFASSTQCVRSIRADELQKERDMDRAFTVLMSAV